MNEAYQAHDGLPPELFPPDVPTYTGQWVGCCSWLSWLDGCVHCNARAPRLAG